jgi:RES domain-containing protein
MPEAWRVVRAEYARTAFDGEGARRAGGRFNSRGTAVVYTADSLALAMLEVAVHLPTYRGLRNRLAFHIEFDEALVETRSSEDLPNGWRATPPGRGTQRVGDIWVSEQRSAVLYVPSVIVPGARNFILNPAHPDFRLIRVDDMRNA